MRGGARRPHARRTIFPLSVRPRAPYLRRWAFFSSLPRRTPMARTLLDKVWDAHTVRTLPSGQTQLLVGLHLVHEVTTPQAFQMLKQLKLKVRMPERTFGTIDHIIRTSDQSRHYADTLAEDMAEHMYRNMKEFGVPLVDMASGRQGIVHVIG